MTLPKIDISYKDNKYYKSQFKSPEKIGQGGFGTVYKTYWKDKKKIVAVKKVSKENQGNGKNRQERIKSEIEIHAGLLDQSIVKLEHFFQDDHNFYLILEYCNKGSLKNFIKNDLQNLSEKKREVQACDIIMQVINAVRYLHSKFIIHRDLSLGNILLKSCSCSEYEHSLVKLADFGIAVKSSNAGENHHTFVGTEGFISPEMFRKVHNEKTDVWSIGSVLHALLVGKLPLKKKYDYISMPDLAIQENDLSDDAKELICAMLEQDYIKRPSINELLDKPFFMKYKFQLPTSSCRDYKSKSSLYSSKFSNDSGLDSLSSKGESKFSSYPGKKFPSYISEYSSKIDILSEDLLYHGNSSKPFINHFNKENKIAENRKFNHLKKNINPLPNRENFLEAIRYRERSCSPDLMKQERHENFMQEEYMRSYDYERKKNETPVEVGKTHSRSVSPSKYSFLNDNKETRERKRRLADLVPLTTTRLHCGRYDCNRKRPPFFMTITKDGLLFMEFYEVTSKGRKRISLVLRISSDGFKISVYKPKRCFIEDNVDKPIPFPSNTEEFNDYNFEELPAKYNKFYKDAKLVTDMYKARTPKITVFGDRAKCQMMENSPPNFCLNFYDGLKLEKKGDKIFIEPENSERILVFPGKVPEKYETALEIFENMKQLCESYECDMVKYAKTDRPAFPLIVGQKPDNREALRSLPCRNMSSQPCYSTDRSAVVNSPSNNNQFSSSPSSLGQNELGNKYYWRSNEDETDILKFLTNYPEIKNKQVVAEFHDGMRMWISYKEREVDFFYDTRSNRKIYNFHETPELREKIHYLDKILRFVENKKNRRIS